MGETIKMWQGILGLGAIFAAAVLAWGRTQWDVTSLKEWRDKKEKSDKKVETLLIRIATKMGIDTTVGEE